MHFLTRCAIIWWLSGNSTYLRVWRSLVSRLNGVQEAAGSNPVTRTKREEAFRVSSLFFCFECRTSGLLLRRQAHFNLPHGNAARSAAFPTGSNPVTRTKKTAYFERNERFFCIYPLFLVHCFFPVYHFSAISPENIASAEENEALSGLIRAQVLERINRRPWSIPRAFCHFWASSLKSSRFSSQPSSSSRRAMVTESFQLSSRRGKGIFSSRSRMRSAPGQVRSWSHSKSWYR